MTQKIIKIGNSQGIIIPKGILKKAGFRSGSKVDINLSGSESLIVSKSGTSTNIPTATLEFEHWLDDFNRQYGSALSELIKKNPS